MKEGVLNRFLFYPNHTACRISVGVPEGVTSCSICGGKGAKYTVAITFASIDKVKLLKARNKQDTGNDSGIRTAKY